MSELPTAKYVTYTFVSALFYGLYLFTLLHCLRWLIFADEGWKLRRKISWTMLAVTIVICLLSTTSRALDLQSSMILVGNENQPAVGELHPRTVLFWMDALSYTSAGLSSLLADAVLIYRCWIIYSRSRWVIVYPIVLWVTGLVFIGLQVYCPFVQCTSLLKSWQRLNRNVGPGTVSIDFWGFSIALNSYSTFMIVRRIYLVAKESKASTSITQLRFSMQVLIESGSLYLAVAIAQFVSWWTPDDYATFIISGINVSIIGITFNLILIRVAQHRVEEREKDAEALPMSGVQFCARGTKSLTRQSRVHTHSLIFQSPHEESNTAVNGNTPSTVSIV